MYLDAIGSITSAESEQLLRVEHHLHLRCEIGSPRLCEYLRGAMAVRTPRLVSLMQHVPGQGQWQDVAQFRKHYAQRYRLGAEEVEAIIARRQADQLTFSARNREFVIEQARALDCVLASHDDASHADAQRARRLGCSIAEFPTSLDAAREARQLGMHIVAGAPNLVRGCSHSGNVAAADLAAEGLVDIFSSDYCPSSLLQAVFNLADLAAVPLHAAAMTVSTTPARALGLNDRGSIEEGKRADLVRVRNTPRGPAVLSVWCAGRQVA